MKSTLIAAFAAPTIALAGLGAGALPLAGGASFEAAYDGALSAYSAEASNLHARSTFVRADLDGSGSLDANEYAALAVVTAELARLNGFVALGFGVEGETVALPIEAPAAMSVGERARVEAVARAAFYRAAGADGLLSPGEFALEQAAHFAAADRNRDGALTGRELVAFAAGVAMIARDDA